MNSTNNTMPSAAQTELLNFINTNDAACIANSLKKVFVMAFFNNDDAVTSKQKDDLFVVYKLIAIANSISER